MSYQKLEGSDGDSFDHGDDEVDSQQHTRPKTTSIYSHISRYAPHTTLSKLMAGMVLGTLLSLLGAGFAIAALNYSIEATKAFGETCIPRKERYDCGNSREEALALGCYFDLLSVSWVPWQCGDRELEADFLKEGPWRYWADVGQTQELKQDELWKRPTMPHDSFHVTMQWHRMHCLYQWRKMHRALDSGRRMDTSYKAYGHTLHCQEVFADTRPLNATGGTVSIHFDSC